MALKPPIRLPVARAQEPDKSEPRAYRSWRTKRTGAAGSSFVAHAVYVLVLCPFCDHQTRTTRSVLKSKGKRCGGCNRLHEGTGYTRP